MSNLNSKKFFVTLAAMVVITLGLIYGGVSAEKFIASIVVVFSTYMAIQTKAETK